MRRVIVVDFDETWAKQYEAEAVALQKTFGRTLVAIDHIGSTSVPGLCAKPILDILIQVEDIEAVDRLNERMTVLGYEALGENGIPQRRYFRKGGDERTHHVHVFPAGSAEAVRHLAFRDYLRAHPAERRRYGERKAELARRFPTDIEAYMDGKHGLIQELEREALAWWIPPFHVPEPR